MSKKEHTPGRWEAKGRYVFAGNNCIGICDTDNDTETRMKANAKLMAAAPDMAEALEPFAEIYEHFIGDDADEDQNRTISIPVKIYRRASAALSKATGGE